MNIILVILLIFMVSACAGPQMMSGSENVRISKTQPNEEDYEFIIEVSCKHGFNARLTSTNISFCITELKNKAFTHGANLVVIENESIGNQGCANCVAMFGSAYKHR